MGLYSAWKRTECQLQQDPALSPGEGTPPEVDVMDSVHLIVESTEMQSCLRLSTPGGWGLSLPFVMVLGIKPGASHMLDTYCLPLS